MTYAVHPAAELFPPMSASEFTELLKDVEKNGQREPILLDGEDRVVDGRNRLKVCEKLGLEPRTKRVTGDGSGVIELVLSLNLHRRHLDASQKALVSSRAQKMFEAAAKERMRAGGGDQKSGRANLPHPIEGVGKARDHAAKLTGVSPRMVESASRVLKSGAPEVVKAVEQGALKVSLAEQLVKHPATEQRRLVSLPLKELRKEIKKMLPADTRPSTERARKLAIASGKHVQDNKGMMIAPLSKEQKAEADRFNFGGLKIWEALQFLAAPPLLVGEFLESCAKNNFTNVQEFAAKTVKFVNEVLEASRRGSARSA